MPYKSQHINITPVMALQHTSSEWQYISSVDVSTKNLRFQFFLCQHSLFHKS